MIFSFSKNGESKKSGTKRPWVKKFTRAESHSKHTSRCRWRMSIQMAGLFLAQTVVNPSLLALESMPTKLAIISPVFQERESTNTSEFKIRRRQYTSVVHVLDKFSRQQPFSRSRQLSISSRPDSVETLRASIISNSNMLSPKIPYPE